MHIALSFLLSFSFDAIVRINFNTANNFVGCAFVKFTDFSPVQSNKSMENVCLTFLDSRKLAQLQISITQ